MAGKSDIEKTLREAKQKRDSGASTEDVVVFLHDAQLTIIDSIKAVRDLYGVGLAVAKKMITESPAWAAEVSAAKPLHDEVVRLFEEISEKERERRHPDGDSID